MKVTIINYGVGNLYSISSGLKRAGFEVEINKEPKGNEDLIVFPGVGSFSAVSNYILGMKGKLEDLKESGTFFLGVCLGLQIMFEKGTEGGINYGLGWFKGEVDKIKGNVKLPHIGWDLLKVVDPSCPLTEGLDNQYVYYVHSYVAYPTETKPVVGVSTYGVTYPAIVCDKNVVGTQFHPEKSSKVGRIFLSNLYRWVKR